MAHRSLLHDLLTHKHKKHSKGHKPVCLWKHNRIKSLLKTNKNPPPVYSCFEAMTDRFRCNHELVSVCGKCWLYSKVLT